MGNLADPSIFAVLPDGRILNKRQLYIEVLRFDINLIEVYFNLPRSLADQDETVALHDDRIVNKRQLYIEALRCDTHCSPAYYSLAYCLSNHHPGTVELPDGRTLTKH